MPADLAEGIGDLSWKDQGNLDFKAGNWLKAAALYTKGLKDRPGDAVLLSNRSAALLKLNKMSKALADAEECIKSRRDWEKGYFRKGNVLEALQKYEEALEAYQEAARRNPSREVTDKVRNISKLARKTATNGHHKSGMTKKKPVEGSATPGGSQQKIRQFEEAIIEIIGKEMQNNTFQQTFPCVYFLPDSDTADGSASMGQVGIRSAFESPDVHSNAMEFLRQYGADNKALAAIAVIPKDRIAYPQTWKRQNWPCGTADGIFMQLEAPKQQRNLWFIPLNQKSRDPVPVNEDFAVLGALFR